MKKSLALLINSAKRTCTHQRFDSDIDHLQHMQQARRKDIDLGKERTLATAKGPILSSARPRGFIGLVSMLSSSSLLRSGLEERENLYLWRIIMLN